MRSIQGTSILSSSHSLFSLYHPTHLPLSLPIIYYITCYLYLYRSSDVSATTVCLDLRSFIESATPLIQTVIGRPARSMWLIVLFILFTNCTLEINHINKKYFEQCDDYATFEPLLTELIDSKRDQVNNDCSEKR